ncbi:hypothetical protein [Actinomadura sp. 3N407]|uniref:D-alanyl-D-alanine carboxypeptidase family protein n=1 Tax=Actinomadura sp. 3N407 TaxID=3457423 RepID=UPI003FCEB88D
MDDAKGEPVTSGSKDEREPARTATAEFRIPAKVSLTRPDIPIRRPAKPNGDPSGEPASPPTGPWYVKVPDLGEKAPSEAAGAAEPDAAKPGAAEDTGAVAASPAPQQDAAANVAPAEDESPRAASPAEAPSKKDVAPGRQPKDAPPSGGTGPTRVERLPAPSSQTAPPQQQPVPQPPPQRGPAPQPPVPQAAPQRQSPAARSSGQWTVPWDGAAPPAPPVLPVPPAAPAAEGTEAKRGRRGLVVLVAVLVLVAGVVTGQLVRPVPEPAVDLAITSSHAFPGQAPALPWPSAGQSVVHVDGLGTMGSSGGSAPTPTASVAKVMTAYVYLRDHPLEPGEAGPVMTVSPQAAAQIPMRKQRGESILGVTANQRLTQRKALEALLIISANDVAHELARWDAGSDQAFAAKMNAAARSLGMTSTRYTDPSGYDSGTVSTAADQVKLLRAAMRIPAFAEIVSKPAYVPDDGGLSRQGGNYLLGQYGVIGGKTGYTDAAGGNFVFAARKDVQGVNAVIVGAVMGQESQSAADAVNAAQRLVIAAEGALVAATLAPKGAKVARVDDGLGGMTPLRAASPVTVVGWPGLTVPVGVEGDPPHQAGTGERVGTLTAGAAKVPLELVRTLDEPSIVERLIRLG